MAQKITKNGYVRLDDGTTFRLSSATKWEENRWFDGHRMISKATCSEWHHQNLYRTAKGKWVMQAWSDWPGRIDCWFEISKKEAKRWFLKNGYDVPPELKDVATEQLQRNAPKLLSKSD